MQPDDRDGPIGAAPPPIGLDRVEVGGEDRRTGLTRQHYLFAAFLFISGGIGAVLPTLFQPPRPGYYYLLPLLAIGSGLTIWALARRLPRRGLHVVAVVGALEIALTVSVVDERFSIYYVLVAIYVAFVLASRRVIALHIGFLALLALTPVIYDPDDVRGHLVQAFLLLPVLILAGGSVAFLRERLEASEARYRELSELDPLTGVGNYRMMGVRVPQELARHRRYGHPLSLLVIDLDDFKRINDEYGHQRGDAVLQNVAAALLGAVREHDIVVRQGGDEFAVVAPETGADAALYLSERLRGAVRAVAPEGGEIGASIGCALFPDDADTLEGLLDVADTRLRGSKQERPHRYGRPRIGRTGREPQGHRLARPPAD